MWSIIVLLAIAFFSVFAINALDKTFTKFLLRQNEKNLHTIHKVSKTIYLLLRVCIIGLLAIALVLIVFIAVFSQNSFIDLIYSLLCIGLILFVPCALSEYFSATALKTSEINSSIQEEIVNENEVNKILSYLEHNDKLVLNLRTNYTPSDLVSEMTYLFFVENGHMTLWSLEPVDKDQKKVKLVLTDALANIFAVKTFTLTEENYTNLIRSFQYTLE